MAKVGKRIFGKASWVHFQIVACLGPKIYLALIREIWMNKIFISVSYMFHGYVWDIAYSVVWYKHMNRTTGFFWQKDGAYTSSGERIVPHAQKE